MSTIDLDDDSPVFKDTHLARISITLELTLTGAPVLHQPYTQRSFIPELVEATMELSGDGEWFADRLRFAGWVVKKNGDQSKVYAHGVDWHYGTGGRYGLRTNPAPEYVENVAKHCVDRVHQVLA